MLSIPMASSKKLSPWFYISCDYLDILFWEVFVKLIRALIAHPSGLSFVVRIKKLFTIFWRYFLGDFQYCTTWCGTTIIETAREWLIGWAIPPFPTVDKHHNCVTDYRHFFLLVHQVSYNHLRFFVNHNPDMNGFRQSMPKCAAAGEIAESIQFGKPECSFVCILGKENMVIVIFNRRSSALVWSCHFIRCCVLIVSRESSSGDW